MDNSKFEEYSNEWIALKTQGKHIEAKTQYQEHLLPEIARRMREDPVATEVGPVDVLFSLLGFSPEPIIYTQCALQARRHVILHDSAVELPTWLFDRYLPTLPAYVTLSGTDFASVYNALLETLVLNPGRRHVIDITGGKKSMVATASIFARDYNCALVYMDMRSPEDYLHELRAPRPGSETLNLVYEPDWLVGV